MLSQDLVQSLAAVTEQLKVVSGQLYRDQGQNIVPTFSQDVFLDSLSTKENPNLKIQFDFTSMSFTDGTDNDTYVYAILGRANAAKAAVKFKNNSVYSTNQRVSEVTLYSPAQVGKKITINLFRDATYASGQLVQSGTVTVAPATALATSAPSGLAATVTALLAADTATKNVWIQSNHSDILAIGGAAVDTSGANTGLKLFPGGTLEIKTTAAIYGKSPTAWAAGDITILKET